MCALLAFALLAGAAEAAAPATGVVPVEPVAPGAQRKTGAGVQSAAVGHDPFAGADEVLRHSFSPDEDRDFDNLPDGWLRRRGVQFPRYVHCGIDRSRGCFRGDARNAARQSLRMKVNGAEAVMYSPVLPLRGIHSYVFEGRILTRGLKHDAAVLSLSFLNARRQRIHRYLTRPVTGTHADWVRLRIGPVAPGAEARFVVIGCHLLQGRRKDIRGDVWFDELWLGRLPLLRLESSHRTHFMLPTVPIEITSVVSGLDAGRRYQLKMQITDTADRLLASKDFDFHQPAVSAARPAEAAGPAAKSPEQHRLNWKIPPQDYGYYQVWSTLCRDEEIIVRKKTTFTVIDLIPHAGEGRFGWSLEQGTAEVELRELAEIAPQAGINWLKLPLWRSMSKEDPELPGRISEFLELLTRRRISAVGLLDEPPDSLRRQFSGDWAGVSEIFAMPTDFWSESLESVIARYSSHVRHWQLGSDHDDSFIGRPSLSEMLGRVKGEFDRIGRDTRVGVHWDWSVPLPPRSELPQAFLSISSPEPLSGTRLREVLRQSDQSGVPRWVLIRPLPLSQHSHELRGADLIQRMVAAHAGGAEAIIASDVFDPEHGMLYPHGAPRRLFLPWRTVATALQGSTWLGSLTLPGNSVNHLFDRGDEVVVVMWSEKPVTERLFLGESARTIDLWGRQSRPQTDLETGEQIFENGPVPTIVRGCSRDLALLQMAVQYAGGQVASASGAHSDAVVGRNTFSQGIDGIVRVRMPADWDVDPGEWPLQAAAGEEFRLPLTLTLPGTASLGREMTSIDFEITADRPYRFRVYRDYEVGLGDLHLSVVERVLPDGRLEIEQVITNNTRPEEVLDFRCSLFVPGRRRQKRLVTRLGNGQDRKLYVLPDFESLRGRDLWLRAEQISGRRVLNFKWKVGSYVETEEEGTDDSNVTAEAPAPGRPSGIGSSPSARRP